MLLNFAYEIVIHYVKWDIKMHDEKAILNKESNLICLPM